MEAKKQKYAVIGDPVKHSLSPKMHNAAFAALGIDAEYSAIHVKEDEIAKFADYARNELAGFNITVPHKENIIPYLDEISDLCKMTNSVNTVTNRNGHLIGDSTDGYGLEMAIKEAFGIDVKGNSFLFLGCGGTVRAVSYHFLQKGAKGLFIANRTISKAEELANSLSGATGVDIAYTGINDLEKLNKYLEDTSVIIQSTSLGLKESDPSPFPESLIRPGICMYDTIYKRTTFLKDAARHNAPNAGGDLMLVHQGAKSFSIWTDQTAPVKIMKNAISG
jgi:shikimate dehydrogenase